jgi:hypothetical protein
MAYPTLSQGARLTAVHLKNAAGEEIGKVVEWMMDVEEGKVVYVLAEIESSSKYYAIPWHFMRADLQHGGYIIDQDEIKKRDVTVDRHAMATLVNDKDFLEKIFDRYGLDMQQSRSPRQPSGTASPDRQGPQKDDGYPSNAKMSEGKGYGG